MEQWILIFSALMIVFVLALLVAFRAYRKRTTKAELPAEVPVQQIPVHEVQAQKAPDLAQKLSRTRGSLLSRLEKFWLGPSKSELEPREWDEIEEVLLEADVGVTTVGTLLGRVKERCKVNGKGLKELMREECEDLFKGVNAHFEDRGNRPLVISVVGVNGVGKTTTIGKLAHHFSRDGKTVLLGAADTFRAAAISQLKIWAERVGAQFVGGHEGGDPGAVAFDALTAAKARNIDVVILDTAGRLHTKTGLMEELKKIHRVMKKVISDAPHETWLVVDGTLGQNSLRQAAEFQKALELTGIIITKLDGTAKGGAVFGIVGELKLPIYFIGVGEAMEDFVPFDSKRFVEAILG